MYISSQHAAVADKRMLVLRTVLRHSSELSWRASSTPRFARLRYHGRMSNSHTPAQQQAQQNDGPSTSRSDHACDIDSHLSQEAKTRTLSTLSKFIFGFSGIPDMVSFHGGLPPPSTFPFKSFKLETRDGQWLDIPAGDKVYLANESKLASRLFKVLPVVSTDSKGACFTFLTTYTCTLQLVCPFCRLMLLSSITQMAEATSHCWNGLSSIARSYTILLLDRR